MDVSESDIDVEVTKPEWGRARKRAFYTIISLLLLGIGAFWKVNLFWLLAWLPTDILESLYASQLELDGVAGPFQPHIVHYLALSVEHVVVLIGLGMQLRRPWSSDALLWQGTGALLLSFLTMPFVAATAGLSKVPPPVFAAFALVIAVALLHPSHPRRTFPRLADRLMSGLWAVAVVPAAFLVVTQMQLELNGVPADQHWQGLHYNFMAEFGLYLILIGLLGASGLSGWRWSAWSASFMVAVLGIGSIVYPHLPGSQGTVRGIVMVVWAGAYLLAAERRHRREKVLYVEDAIAR